MPTKPLTQITLFTMGRDNLEKRILKTYADLSDSDAAIQYIVAVLIRHCLCISDFSGICSELVRDIFLSEEPTDVLRKFFPLFREAFKSGKEWEQATRRLYKNTKEYHRYNNRLSDSKKYLFGKTTSPEEMGGQQYKLVSTFEDAVGKSHSWSLRDADPHSSALKIDAVLELLSTLTIFEKDGIRRFVKLENSEIDNCTRYLKIKKGEIVEESEVLIPVEPTVSMADLMNLSGDEKLELVKQLLPEGMFLTDMRGDDRENPQPEIPALAAAEECPPANDEDRSKAREERKEKTTNTPAPEQSLALSAEKKPYIDFRKPKSEKQKNRERKDELYKQTKKGKSHSRKKKKR
ncbi:glycosyltransferase family 1 protein [Enterococcus gilvus]|jgi:hypothetical protein|uniref:glycosyltransferase family 1 protein n=1 Tax=Enterococcus gilvus TaxID=160453 RepID=UPI000DF61EF2|nr:glycosyltransferase family 1 protein [Enterococcus gilvus]AXG39576.1 glycosyltransferase family 1 protein [Enterococcus gilvus]